MDAPVFVTLGEIAELVRGISFPTDAKNREPFDNSVACLRTTNVQREVEWDDLWYVAESHVRKSDQYLKSHDILVSMSNSLELVGKSAIVRNIPFSSTFGAFIAALRVYPELDASYVYYMMNAPQFLQYLRSIASTTTNISNINGSKLMSSKIPLAPLAEQRRIVSKIEELFSRLDEGEAALQRVQKLLVSYRQAVLKAAVTGELTKEWRAANHQRLESGEELLQRILVERKAKWEAANPGKKYQPPSPPDMSNLPALPESWTWVAVEQIGMVQLGRQRSPRNHTGPYMRPYLRAANATWNGANLSDVMEMNFSPADFARYRLSKWDILLSEASGSANEVGKPFIWHEQIPNCCFQNTLIRVKVDQPYIEPMYILTHFQKDARTGTFAKVAKGIGIHHLGAEKMSKLPLALPPLSEQKAISDEVERRMSIIDAISLSIRSKLETSNQLRQSILKAAFCGQLVPQDPDDEPASALLARIQSERQSPAPSKAARPAKARPPKQATLWEPT